jgi:hypothetical protein
MQTNPEFLSSYGLQCNGHYGQDMETVELDRLSFVVQQVVDILLEKSQNNYEHLHTVDLIINSLLEYLQRLRASIPLESVVPPPKLSVEIVLLYGLSKLYIREEPHVSIGLKMLLPLLAQLRADDKVVGQTERNLGLGSGFEFDPLGAVGTGQNDLLGAVVEGSSEGIVSAPSAVEHPRSADAAADSGSVVPEEIGDTVGAAAASSMTYVNVDGALPAQGTGVGVGEDIYGESFSLFPATDYDKEFARKELEGLERSKHDSQTFLLRQRLRVAEELTHIGMYELFVYFSILMYF